MDKYIEIMVDIETTGTKPGCHILSIGACTFGHGEEKIKQFFFGSATMNDESFTALPSTMAWWEKQTLFAKAEAFAGIKRIDEVLLGFASFLASFPSFRIWGNAASFDLKIIEHAYEVCQLDLPWNYRYEMCYRTLKNLYPNIPFKKPRNAHSALEDAIAQANHADEIFAYKRAVEEGGAQ